MVLWLCNEELAWSNIEGVGWSGNDWGVLVCVINVTGDGY